MINVCIIKSREQFDSELSLEWIFYGYVQGIASLQMEKASFCWMSNELVEGFRLFCITVQL